MQEIQTHNAPLAIGPYSQAVLANGFLFISGQIPLHPLTGRIESTQIEQQIEQVFLNLEAILKKGGLSFDHVVKAEVFLTDLSHFPLVNQAFSQAFTGKVKPARQTIQVCKLPLNALIEISLIAVTTQSS